MISHLSNIIVKWETCWVTNVEVGDVGLGREDDEHEVPELISPQVRCSSRPISWSGVDGRICPFENDECPWERTDGYPVEIQESEPT